MNEDGSWDRSWEEAGTLPPVLKAKASAGVKVYIILWNIIDGVQATAPVCEATIERLEALHENIRVVTSPGLWPITNSQHQKFVVVDRSVAILGGVDWTYARWDTIDHELFDPMESLHPGLDARGQDELGYPIEAWWEAPEDSSKYFDRQTQPCHAWQDVSVRVWQQAAADVASNFIERWEYMRTEERSLLDKAMPVIPAAAAPPPLGDARVLSLAEPKTLSGEAAASMKCHVVRSMGEWSR